MKKTILFTLITITFSIQTSAQSVAINKGKSAAHASAIWNIKSTTKGLLIPKMTLAQRNAVVSPANGLLIYDSTTTGFCCYNGSAYTQMSRSGSGRNLSDKAGTIKPILFRINNIKSPEKQ